MKKCPNKSSKEWRDLVFELQGNENLAFYYYDLNNQVIPNINNLEYLEEKSEIYKSIKNLLLDHKNTKPEGNDIFFSYFKESKKLSKTLQNTIDYVNKKYGNAISTSENTYGVVLNINVSNSIVKDIVVNKKNKEAKAALNRAAKEAGIDNNEYIFSRHSTSSKSQFNDSEFEGDNYKSFLEYKIEENSKIQNNITRINSQLENNSLLSNSNRESKLKELDRLEKESDIITRQIYALNKDPQDYIFHAIEEDLSIIENEIESSDTDLMAVKDKLQFYIDFGKSIPKEDKKTNPKFHELLGRAEDLIGEAETISFSNVRTMIENNEAVAKIKGENPDIDIFHMEKDINIAESLFLGMDSTSTDEGIIPAFVKRFYKTKLREKESYIKSLGIKVNSLVEQNPGKLKDPDWIKQVTSNGEQTGYLLNIFSTEYFNKNYIYRESLKKFHLDPSRENSNKVLQSLLKNNALIDFTKIGIIKDAYQHIYPEHFTNSDVEIEQYETQMKNLLGTQYDITVEKILSKLASFESKKENLSFNELASQDIWEVNKQVNKLGKKELEIVSENDRLLPFLNFSGLISLPRTKINGKETGYYDSKFKEIEQDSVLLEYYNTVKEIAEYISTTYDKNEMGQLSYPKVQQRYVDRVSTAFKDSKISGITNFSKLTLEEYKSWFYTSSVDFSNIDKNQVRKNSSDEFNKKVRDLTQLYVSQGLNKKEAYTKAADEVSREYDSTDFNASLLAGAMEAAIHSARMESQPEIRAMINAHRIIAEEATGKTDSRSMKKLQAYYDSSILNLDHGKDESKFENKKFKPGLLHKILELIMYPFVKDKSLIKEKASKHLKLLDDTEKKLYDGYLERISNSDSENISFRIEGIKYHFKELEDGTIIYYEGEGIDKKTLNREEYTKKIEEHFRIKMSELGLDRSIAGFIDGVLKTIIFKGLGLNPVSGTFNRIEGKHSSLLMDATGEYWTPGNIFKANNLMAFANISKLTKDKIPLRTKSKIKTMEIFESLLDQFNVFQDRKNELQRAAEEADGELRRKLKNPFAMAVDNPEFKNQGAIMMAIMMDFMTTNSEGQQVPILDIETGMFNNEFLNEDNTLNLSEEQLNDLVLKMSNAVSRSQGNYDVNDIMLAKKSILGRAGTIFMTWLPEQLNQRFGITGKNKVDLNTGKKKKDGRFIEAYKTNKTNTTIAAVIGITAGLGISPIAGGIMGASALGMYVYNKFVSKNVVSEESIRSDYDTAKELMDLLKSIAIESLNYPFAMFNQKQVKKNNTFSYLSENDRNAMITLSRELGVVLTMLGLKLLMGMAMYDEDDDKESNSRMRHNFVQNQLSRVISSITMYSNPHQLVSDTSRMALIEALTDGYKVIGGLVNEDLRDKWGENIWDITPTPRILHKGAMPWHDKMNYDDMTTLGGIPSPMKWMSESLKSPETKAKKEYNKILRDIREDLKEDLIDKHQGKKEPLSKDLTKLVEKKIKGYKKPNQNYQDKVDQLKKLGY